MVNVYSTLGGISLYLCFSKMPPFSSSLSLIESVLVLKPFNAFLNCLCLTGFVVQHKGSRLAAFYQTHRNVLQLNKSMIISGAAGFFISAIAADVVKNLDTK